MSVVKFRRFHRNDLHLNPSVGVLDTLDQSRMVKDDSIKFIPLKKQHFIKHY